MPVNYLTATTAATTNWGTGSNWSLTTAPADGEDVWILTSAALLDAGLAQSAVEPASINVTMAFTGTMGSTSAYLVIGPLVFNYGLPANGSTEGSGSGRIKVDFGTDPVVCNVYDTADSGTDSNLEPVRLLFNSASSSFNQSGGLVGIATTNPAETSTLGDINVNGSDSELHIGNVTWSNINQSGGTITLRTGGTSTTIDQSGGTIEATGDFIVGTWRISDATASCGQRRTVKSCTITRSSQTATVSCTAHGYSNGDLVRIRGAAQDEYNGIFPVTNSSANAFDYVVEGSPATPATGTITVHALIATTLDLYDGAVFDVSSSAIPCAVKTINVYGDATIRRNAADPDHFRWKYITFVRGNLSIEL